MTLIIERIRGSLPNVVLDLIGIRYVTPNSLYNAFFVTFLQWVALVWLVEASRSWADIHGEVIELIVLICIVVGDLGQIWSAFIELELICFFRIDRLPFPLVKHIVKPFHLLEVIVFNLDFVNLSFRFRNTRALKTWCPWWPFFELNFLFRHFFGDSFMVTFSRLWCAVLWPFADLEWSLIPLKSKWVTLRLLGHGARWFRYLYRPRLPPLLWLIHSECFLLNGLPLSSPPLSLRHVQFIVVKPLVWWTIC